MATSRSEVDLKTGEMRLTREIPAIPVHQNKRSTFRPLNSMNGDHLLRLMRVDGTSDVVHYNSVTEQDLARSLRVWYRGHRSVLEDLQRGQRHLYRTMCRLHREKQRLLRQEHIRRTEEIKAKMDWIRVRGPVTAAIRKWRENMERSRKQRESLETPQSVAPRRRSLTNSRRNSLANGGTASEGVATPATETPSCGGESVGDAAKNQAQRSRKDSISEKGGDNCTRGDVSALTNKALKKFALGRRGSRSKDPAGQEKETPGSRKSSLKGGPLLLEAEEAPKVVRSVTIVYGEDEEKDSHKANQDSSPDVASKSTDVDESSALPQKAESSHVNAESSNEDVDEACASPPMIVAEEVEDEEFLAKLNEWSLAEKNFRKAKYKRVVEQTPEPLPALREEDSRLPSAVDREGQRSRSESRSLLGESRSAEASKTNLIRIVEVSKDNDSVTVTRTHTPKSKPEVTDDSSNEKSSEGVTSPPDGQRAKPSPSDAKTAGSPDGRAAKGGVHSKNPGASEDSGGKPEVALPPVKGRKASLTRPPDAYLRDNFRRNSVAGVTRPQAVLSPTSTSSQAGTLSPSFRDPRSRRQSLARQVRALKQRKAARRAASLNSERLVGYLLRSNGSLVQLMAEPQRKNFAPPNDREQRQRQVLMAEERSREEQRKARVEGFFQTIFPHEDPEEAERRRAALAAPKEEPQGKGSTLANFLFKLFRDKPMARGVDPNSMDQVAKCHYIRVYDPSRKPADAKMVETSWRRRQSDPRHDLTLRDAFPLSYSGYR